MRLSKTRVMLVNAYEVLFRFIRLLRNLIHLLKPSFLAGFYPAHSTCSLEPIHSQDSKLQAVSKNQLKNIRFFQVKQVTQEVYCNY